MCDVVDLIEDMTIVARECVGCVDGRVPLAVYNTAINTHIVTNTSITSGTHPHAQRSTGTGSGSGSGMSRKPLTAKELWPHYIPPVDPRIAEEEAAAIAAMAAAVEAEEKKKKGKRGKSGSVTVAAGVPKPGKASDSVSLQPVPPSNVVPSATKSGGVGAGRKAIQK